MSQELIDGVFNSSESINRVSRRMDEISSSMLDIGMEGIGEELHQLARLLERDAKAATAAVAKYINTRTGAVNHG